MVTLEKQRLSESVVTHQKEREVCRGALRKRANLDARKQWARLADGQDQPFPEDIICLGCDCLGRPALLRIHDHITE